MAWLIGDRCVRCNRKRTKTKFEGLPTCGDCELRIRAARETKRRCPIDGAEMEKEVIQNVIVDRCRACSGVWLDGGELDLLRKAIQAGAGGDFTMGLAIGLGAGMAPGH